MYPNENQHVIKKIYLTIVLVLRVEQQFSSSLILQVEYVLF